MKVIIEGRLLERIPYMENPPIDGGEITYLTHEEFNRKFNCVYTESIFVRESTRDTATEEEFVGATAKAVYERTLRPLESLVICKMSDEVGYGLFALDDIPLGTPVCVYAGEYNRDCEAFSYVYSFVDAEKIGGLARFMQHHPSSEDGYRRYVMASLEDYRLFAITENITEEEARDFLRNPANIVQKIAEYDSRIARIKNDEDYTLDEFIFNDPNMLNQIAQSNVHPTEIIIGGANVVLMIASRDIKKNEAIGYSYGPRYFYYPSLRCIPRLFNKVGHLIPTEDYRYQIPPKIQSWLEAVFFLSLKNETEIFFQNEGLLQWRDYPADALKGKYTRHCVEYLNFPSRFSRYADSFFEHLKKTGFDAEMRQTKSSKTSILVDLTTSTSPKTSPR